MVYVEMQTLSTEDQSVTLVYVDGTKGWRAVQDSTSGVSGAGFYYCNRWKQ